LVINRFYAQIGRRFFAVDDVINVNDMTILRIAGIRRSGFRIRQTLPAIDEILRGNRRAVRPFRIFTQMEGPDFKIFIIPGFCDPRDRVAFFRRISNPSNKSRLMLDSGTPSILCGSRIALPRRYYVPAFVYPPAVHQQVHPLPWPYCARLARIDSRGYQTFL
jgi:hypothetical protein